MTTTLPTTPTITQTIDNAFTHTWNKIRAEAVDNIIDANVVSAALKAAGCFKAQVGGEWLNETISYAEAPEPTDVGKGDTLTQGETEFETAAMWPWKYFATHVQRARIGRNSDQTNNGAAKIKSLVETKLTKARDSMTKKLETVLTAAYSATAESSKAVQGLNELIPPYTYKAAAVKYGNILRSNDWWQAKYKAMTTNPEVNLLSDMKNLYNTCSNNSGETPNLIITTQQWFELYEDFALDQSQIIKEASTKLADLGYEVLKFKGKSLVWTDKVGGYVGTTLTYQNMLMLNTDYIKVMYDPQCWFEMSAWKDIPLQFERIAHFLSACNVIGTQPRRQGKLYENAGY